MDGEARMTQAGASVRSQDKQPWAIRGDDGELPAARPQWRAWARAGLGVVAIAFVNGVSHRSYEGTLSELGAHQLSTGVLLLLLAPWVLRIERRHPLPTGSAAAGRPVLGCRDSGFRVRLRPLRKQTAGPRWFMTTTSGADGCGSSMSFVSPWPLCWPESGGHRHRAANR